MTNNKYLTIKIAVEIGKKIQEFYPVVGSFYLASLNINGHNFPLHISINDIAEILYSDEKSIELLDVRSKSVLENAVKYALIGNSDGKLGFVYGGLLTIEEYSKIARQNRINSGSETAEKSKERRKGALFLSREELCEAARKAAISRGEKPWTEEERETASSLKLKNYSAKGIGEILGRTRYSVLEMFRREKKKNKK